MVGVFSMIQEGDELTIEGETFEIERIDRHNRLLYLEGGQTVHSASLHSTEVSYTPMS